MHTSDTPLGTVTADAAGTATLAWTIPATLEPGTHSVELAGTHSGSASKLFQVTATPTAVDPIKSYLSGPGQTGAGTGGSDYVCDDPGDVIPGKLTVTVHAIDTTNQAVAGAAVIFTVPTGLKAETPVQTTTDASGVARLQVSATAAGVYPVTATVAGTAIQTGSPAQVTFDDVIAPTIPLINITAVSPSNGSVVAGGTDGYEVTLATVNACGTTIGNVNLTLTPATGLSLSAATVTTNASGEAKVRATAAVAGSYKLQAQNTAGQSTETTLTFKAPGGTPNGPTVSVTIQGSTATVKGAGFQAGETVQLYADTLSVGQQAADAAGQVTFTWALPADLPVGPHTIRLVGERSGQATATVTVNADGTLAVTGAPIAKPVALIGLLALLVGGLGVVGSVAWRRRGSAWLARHRA
jgi:adhesin/invasin